VILKNLLDFEVKEKKKEKKKKKLIFFLSQVPLNQAPVENIQQPALIAEIAEEEEEANPDRTRPKARKIMGPGEKLSLYEKDEFKRTLMAAMIHSQFYAHNVDKAVAFTVACAVTHWKKTRDVGVMVTAFQEKYRNDFQISVRRTASFSFPSQLIN